MRVAHIRHAPKPEQNNEPGYRIALVVTRCEACEEIAMVGTLCFDCSDRARAHIEDDPYDILGGEDGWR